MTPNCKITLGISIFQRDLRDLLSLRKDTEAMDACPENWSDIFRRMIQALINFKWFFKITHNTC